ALRVGEHQDIVESNSVAVCLKLRPRRLTPADRHVTKQFKEGAMVPILCSCTPSAVLIGSRRCLRRLVCPALLASILLWPGMGAAQSTIAGAVRDATGAVLPGVTVEAASPALIEKVRSVVTNGQGRYSIVDLRPGLYAVTFSLPGFQTVRREGIEVVADATVPINAEMRVGAVEETITVSGATPVVDVQQAGQRQVLNREGLDTLPSAGEAPTRGSSSLASG